MELLVQPAELFSAIFFAFFWGCYIKEVNDDSDYFWDRPSHRCTD